MFCLVFGFFGCVLSVLFWLRLICLIFFFVFGYWFLVIGFWLCVLSFFLIKIVCLEF